MKLTPSILRKIIKEEVAAVTQAPKKKDAAAAEPAAPAAVNPALVAKVLAGALGIPAAARGRSSGDWLKDVVFFNSWSSGRFGAELPFEGPLKGAFYGEIRGTHLKEMGFKSVDDLARFLADQGASEVAGKDDMEGAMLGDLVTGM